MRLYIIRHGDPDYANNTITPAGHLEAQALAKKFQKTGLDEIYTSPYGRAIDTAKYTEEALGLGHQVEDWTRELWPELFAENHPVYGNIGLFDIPGAEYRGGPELPSHDNWHKHQVFGEHDVKVVVDKVRENSDAFLIRLGFQRENGVYRRVKEVPDQVAVFCHLGFGLTWLSVLLEIPTPLVWCGFFMPTSSVTTVLFEERSEGYAVPRCIGVGDISHLYESGLPMSKMGLNVKL